jgi:hypothetical protein
MHREVAELNRAVDLARVPETLLWTLFHRLDAVVCGDHALVTATEEAFR